ncbi:MAG TPA: AraC family transcriptional regulator [Nocardioidaceae bacterium]|nr:AraC family transcriptional regulator [Nocardioidaceae bacterium]
MDVRRTHLEHWDFPRGTASSLLMVSFAEREGVAPEALLAGTGLSLQTLRDPRREITAHQELQVAERLVAELDRPALGIAVGLTYPASTFGIFGYAALTSPTLRAAIEFGLRYYELSFGFCLPTVELGEEQVRLTLADPGLPEPLSHFLIERDLASIYRWTVDLVGAVPLDEVAFSFTSQDEAAYEAALGLRPSFGHARTSTTFTAAILDQPLPQANEVTVLSAEDACRAMLAERRSRTGIAHDVRDCLVSASGPPPTIDEVARLLNTSERTLRRHLAEEGTSYRALLGEVRLTLAEQMLATGALSVEDVAIRLGYAEATPFIAAFKKWTGVTPARWQRRG